ncbi:MAG: lysophospholipid acyltransferase family protein [Ignavibacteria bacterium]|nr:lysophospholipid acyltransferase family protein [Ignavibacteria bacterium]
MNTYWIVYVAMKAMGWLSGKLSNSGRYSLGKAAGSVMRKLDSKRWNITLDNLQKAFPERAESQRHHVAIGAYENLGQVLVETIALPSMSAIDITRSMKINGIDQLQYRAKNKLPSILLSGHFGNWEYLAASAGISMNAPITVVTHNMRNHAVNERVNAYRTAYGNKVISMDRAAKTLVHEMRNGGAVAFLVDQFADSDKNPLTTFFGRQTPTYGAPALLALRFQVPIFYAFAVRTGPGTYSADLIQLDITGIPSNAEGVRRLTQMHVDVLESAIRLHPDHWSWQHRRWRPEQTVGLQ